MFNNRKKIIIISLLSIILIIIAIVIISVVAGNKNIGYDTLEEKLSTAAQLYYSTNKKLLPTEEGDETSVTIKKLVSEEYIKPLEKLIENGDKCSGSVKVKNVGNDYAYIPYINCGTDYTTIELYDKILEENSVVTENKGLYYMNNNYIFRGEVENNYISINGNLWKIMALNSDETIKIIYAGKSEKSVYDDRYNAEKQTKYGKNDYTISRIYENLNLIIDNENIFSTDFKARIVKTNACIAGKSKTDENNSMDVECANTFDNQYATLITLSEYISASLDSGCKNASSSECQNYNYLSDFADGSNWWTITPNADNSYQAYQISSYGSISLTSCYSLGGIRPIVYLSGDTTYKSGDGSINNPYIIFSSDIEEE